MLQKRCQKYFRVIEFRKTGLGARKIHQITSINEGIIKHWIHSNMKPIPIKALDKLKQPNLIPLNLSLHNERNLILVRCIGFVFGDGHIRKTLTTTRFTGQLEDLMQLKNDLEKIGLVVSNPRENTKNSWNGKSWEICVYNFGFARLLKILGCPEGDKTLKQFSIPEWILKDKVFMREFINTLFGNECQKICLRSKRIGTVQFKMVKSIELQENLVFFLNQIRDYLRKFVVETGEIKFKKSYIRETDNKEMVIAYFNINMNKKNVLRISKMLSFKYAALKQKLFEECVEKTTQYLHKILGRITLYNKTIRLNKVQNLKCSEISEKLNVPLSTVNNWINGYKPQFINNEEEIINLLRLTKVRNLYS